MTKEQKEEALGYLKRSIPDVARKCGITDEEVILIMSEIIPCELKNHEVSEDDFTVITWPEIQEYMHEDGFDINSSLANDEWSLEEYGLSAYFVNKLWLDVVLKKRREEEEADAFLSTIEAHEQIQ